MSSLSTNKSALFRLAFFATTAAIVLFGIYVRFDGIASLQITTDEYLISKSIANIIEYGLPQFPSGGYYHRGVLIQYLMAPLVIVMGNEELALRILPVLFNIIAIPALFLLVRNVAGVTIATIATILFSLSLWEIEIARYIRMYSAFQAIFLWYLYFLYKVVIESKSSFRKYIYILSFISIFVYEGAIFLVLLNFLPFVFGNQKISIKDVLYCVSLLVFAVIFFTTNFPELGVVDSLPIDYQIAQSTANTLPLILPKLLVETIPISSVWLIAFLVLALISIVFCGKIIKAEVPLISRFVLFLLVAFALFNQFGLIIYGTILFLLLGWLNKNTLRSDVCKISIGLVLLLFGFWVAYLLSTDYWHVFFQKDNYVGVKKAFVVLLKYPNVFDTILYEYIIAVPAALFIFGIFVTITIIDDAVNPRENKRVIRFLLLVLVIVCGAVGVLKTPYKATLYTFFIYPLLIFFVANGIAVFAGWLTKRTELRALIMVLMLGLVIITSEDYNLKHLFNINDPQYKFRLAYDWPLKGHYIYREDYRTPAEQINRLRNAEDLVVTTLFQSEYYLDHLDYLFLSEKQFGFPSVSRKRGTVEAFTNRALIHRESRLFETLRRPGSTVWLLMHAPAFKYRSEIEMKLADEFQNNLFKTGVDNMIAVYMIKNPK
jgi:hypothetical protein